MMNGSKLVFGIGLAAIFSGLLLLKKPKEKPPVSPGPPTPLEILDLKINGVTKASVSPRQEISATVSIKVNEMISFTDALIYFGRAYEKGMEPQPLPCPPETPPCPTEDIPYLYTCCEPAVLDYIHLEDNVFLRVPLLGRYAQLPTWKLDVVYFNGYSEMKGSTNPWHYSSGSNAFPGPTGFGFLPGKYDLTFPRPEAAQAVIVLPVTVSDQIQGTFDALVKISDYWTIFPNVLTVGSSPYNPGQLPFNMWLDQAIKPRFRTWTYIPPEIPQIPSF